MRYTDDFPPNTEASQTFCTGSPPYMNGIARPANAERVTEAEITLLPVGKVAVALAVEFETVPLNGVLVTLTGPSMAGLMLEVNQPPKKYATQTVSFNNYTYNNQELHTGKY